MKAIQTVKGLVTASVWKWFFFCWS